MILNLKVVNFPFPIWRRGFFFYQLRFGDVTRKYHAALTNSLYVVFNDSENFHTVVLRNNCFVFWANVKGMLDF